MDGQSWKHWVHVTKLDPDKHLSSETIDAVATSGTDALVLSGTLNVTRENLERLMKQVALYDLPLVVEPASPETVRYEGASYLFVPSVINSRDVTWIVGKHRDWVLHHTIPWEMVVPEAYIVLNPDSAVGQVTRAVCELSPRDVAAYAVCAERYFRFPLIYIEYSGIYGDPAMVAAAGEALDESILFYGGGIDSRERAAEMGKYADTIVVGNAVYEKGARVLRETVAAVQ